ncbi:MAG: hypothetical protein IPK18_10495 [Sphingobacteriales bacterium]|nr:MAG: hypothetical protein IPK18_10495 [Sphingobacteriales bacterium]
MKKYFLCVLVLCSLLLNAKQTEVYIQPNLILKYDEQKWPTYSDYYLNHDAMLSDNNELLSNILNKNFPVHYSIGNNKYICYDGYLISDSLAQNRLQIKKIEDVPTKYNNPTSINYYYINKEMYSTTIVDRIDDAQNKQYKQFAVFHYPIVTQKNSTKENVNDTYLAYYFEGKTVYAIHGVFTKNANDAKVDFYEILDNIEFTTPEKYDKKTGMPISIKEVDVLIAEAKNKLHSLLSDYLQINKNNTPIPNQIKARNFAKLLEYTYGTNQNTDNSQNETNENLEEKIENLIELIKSDLESAKSQIYVDSLENMYARISVANNSEYLYDSYAYAAEDYSRLSEFTTQARYLKYDSLPFVEIKKYINGYLPSIVDSAVNETIKQYNDDTAATSQFYTICNKIYDAIKQQKPQEDIDDLIYEFKSIEKGKYTYEELYGKSADWKNIFLQTGEIGTQLEYLITGTLEDNAVQFTAKKNLNGFKELEQNATIEDYFEFIDKPLIKNNIITNYFLKNHTISESRIEDINTLSKYIDEKILKDPIKTYALEKIKNTNRYQSMDLEEQIFSKSEPKTHWYVAYLYHTDILNEKISDSVLLVGFRLNENRTLYVYQKFLKTNNTNKLEYNIEAMKVDENKNYLLLYESEVEKIEESDLNENNMIEYAYPPRKDGYDRVQILNYRAINNQHATVELPKRLLDNYKNVYRHCAYEQTGCGDKATYDFTRGELIKENSESQKTKVESALEKNILALERKVEILDSLSWEYDDNTIDNYTDILLKKSYNSYVAFLQYANELDSMRNVDMANKYYAKIDAENAKIDNLQDFLYDLEDAKETEIKAADVLLFSDLIFEDIDGNGTNEILLLGVSNGDLVYYDVYTINNNNVEKYKNQNAKKQILNTIACKSFLKYSKRMRFEEYEIEY